MKREQPDVRTNRSMMLVTYLLVAVFVGMVGYFGYFLQAESGHVINNSYNARLDRFADRIVRGQILGSDGRMLAGTQTGEDGGSCLSLWQSLCPCGGIFRPGQDRSGGSGQFLSSQLSCESGGEDHK